MSLVELPVMQVWNVFNGSAEAKNDLNVSYILKSSYTSCSGQMQIHISADHNSISIHFLFIMTQYIILNDLHWSTAHLFFYVPADCQLSFKKWLSYITYHAPKTQ